MIRAFRLWDERREGYEEGYAEGQQEAQQEMILQLLNHFEDVAEIAELLEVPVEEVRRVAEEHHLPEQA